METRRLFVRAALIIACLSSASSAQTTVSATVSAAVGARPPANAARPLVSGRLYLNVGTIETALLPNLKDARRGALQTNRACVLQLTGPITPKIRRALENAGVEIGDYLPQHAYAVDLSRANQAALSAIPSVAWIGEYRNEWKIDPECGKRPHHTAARVALAEQNRVPVIITLFADRPAGNALTAIRAVNGAVIYYHERVGRHETISAGIAPDRLSALAALDAVQYIEEAPEITFRNSTDRWIVQSNQTDVTPLYDIGIHGEGQIVGVLDGQADQHHCSLDGGKILFYNAADGDDTHGTHVSCTAVGDAGVFDNTRGVAYLANMVYNTVPAFNEAGITARLSLHHSQGARVHTNSWGDDGTTNYNSLTRGFDVFLYGNEEDLVCLAVTNLSSLRNPENAKNLLACGASKDTPNQSDHCSGGSGPTADGRRKPEIYAPGCSTQSAVPSACNTGPLTGTSMATPAIAGTGALVRQYYLDGFYPSGVANPGNALAPSGALVKATLINAAVDMTGVGGYPSNQEGWGRLLADEALFFAGETRKLLMLEDRRNVFGLSTGEVVEHFFEVTNASEKLKVTLVWTDPPASASTGSAQAAVNDLDLEAVAPNGDLFLGNVFTTGQSATGGTKDDRNNVEQVHLNVPQTGVWTIRVRAAAINQDTQGFALIATGDITPQLPALTINLPNGPPDMLSPDASVSFDVEIVPVDEALVPGSPTLHYRYDGGVFLTSALTSLGGDLYQATLPPANCGTSPEFYVSAEGDMGTIITSPPDAPTTVYTATVATGTIAFFQDNFETDQGWTLENLGATAGLWERAVPVNDPGWAFGPISDSDGSGQCFVTDNAAGNSDIDPAGGAVRLTSPMIDMSASNIVLSYDYFLSLSNANGADLLKVEINDDGGVGPWLQIAVHDLDGGQTWRNHVITQAEMEAAGVVLNATMMLRFTANDGSPASIAEAGLDALLVVGDVCDQAPPPPAEPTGVAATDGAFCDKVTLVWNAAAFADDYEVWRNSVNDPLTALQIASGVAATTHDDTAVAPGDAFFYWVKACNLTACSAMSAPDAGSVGLLADFDGDGDTDGDDIAGFINAQLAAPPVDACADLAAPFGVLDSADTTVFVNLLLAP